MASFFRAYQAVKPKIPTYFIESTAPDNVDDTARDTSLESKELRLVDSDQAVRDIAAALAPGENSNLVVMVHGFNNPQADVVRMYTGAATSIAEDDAIADCKNLVCVGYRWPSEKIRQPAHDNWQAMPTLPTWILYLGIALVLLPLLFYAASDQFRTAVAIWIELFVAIFGFVFAGLVLTAALLRTIVYFRDSYRATNYGVPDLVQIIRAIDSQITDLRGSNTDHRPVQLSFIGHSMGGFVVTNTIRVLTNVFDRKVASLNAYGAGSPGAPEKSIGHSFELTRFILASPDIPAETLLSNRGNFLATALSRFREAFLFSNEGDEVLRQISTLANYFTFPTRNRKHGFRLGNVEILSERYGLLDVLEPEFLSALRIGDLTLQQLYDALESARRQRNAQATSADRSLPERFSYFDCTDYVEPTNNGGKIGLLTFAKELKRGDPHAKMNVISHLHLLVSYLSRQKPNVHGGYFEGKFSQQLIYRLACLGYNDTVRSYGSEERLSEICQARQIRALLSPRLAEQRQQLRTDAPR